MIRIFDVRADEIYVMKSVSGELGGLVRVVVNQDSNPREVVDALRRVVDRIEGEYRQRREGGGAAEAK